MNIKKMLEELMEGAGLDDDNKVVVKSFPLEKSEIKMQKDIIKKGKKMIDTMGEIKNERDKMWAAIQLRLDLFGEDLHYNEKTSEVEILKDMATETKSKD